MTDKEKLGIIKNLYHRYNAERSRCGRKGTAYEYVYFGFESFREFLEYISSLEREVINGIQCYSFDDFCKDPSSYDLDKDVMGLGYTVGGVKILLKTSNRNGVVVVTEEREYPSIAHFKALAPAKFRGEEVSRERFEYEVDRAYVFFCKGTIEQRDLDNLGIKTFIRRPYKVTDFDSYMDIFDKLSCRKEHNNEI